MATRYYVGAQRRALERSLTDTTRRRCRQHERRLLDGCRGFPIENGQRGPAVQEMNVTGNPLELFGQLVGVGNDPVQRGPARRPRTLAPGCRSRPAT
jgi:hypothetical protein